MEEKKTRGRPSKLTTEERMKIVDSFFLYEAGLDPKKMQARDIFAQLARYAENLAWVSNGTKITPKNLSNDPAIREHIEALSCRPARKNVEKKVGVYVPLNMSLLACKSREEILENIRIRDGYYEELCRDSGEVAKHNKELQKDNNMLREEIFRVNQDLAAANERVAELEQQVAELRRETARVTKVAKKAGDLAVKNYFEATHEHGLPDNVISIMARTPIGGCADGPDEASTQSDNDFMEWNYNE